MEAAPVSLSRFAVDLLLRLQQARSKEEVGYILANETWPLLRFRQAILWEIDPQSNAKLHCVSGLAKLGEDSPFSAWLKKLAPVFVQQAKVGGGYLSPNELSEAHRNNWAEWFPGYLFLVPIKGASPTNPVAMLAVGLTDPLSDEQLDLLDRVSVGASAVWLRTVPKGRVRSFSQRSRFVAGFRRFWPWVIACAAVLSLLIPVRLSVLSPAEVIALEAQVLSAPLDGVIKTVHVQPNQTVQKADKLFALDDTTLRNRKEIAQKQLLIARTDVQIAQQKAIGADSGRQDIASLQGRVAERLAEIEAIDEQLQRLDILAPSGGVVLFGDVNDWLGKPVITGERIAQLAEPSDAGLLIWLPVAEALTLEPGAPIQFFLQVDPLSEITGKIYQTSYQATLSPEGIASYRLRAKFELETAKLPRIGLKGTVKIYGAKAPLAVYLFRRPLSTLREWVGW